MSIKKLHTRRHSLRSTLILCGSFLIVLSTGAFAQSNYALWGAFENSLKEPPAENPPIEEATSATLFGGHVGPYAIPSIEPPPTPAVPASGGVVLSESAFGQAAAESIPFPDFQEHTLATVRRMLYYDAADLTGEYGREVAAFRYRVLLYEADAGTVTTRFEDMGTLLWTITEQERADQAARMLRDALRYDPMNQDLRNLLLDVYYDTAVANLAAARERMVEVEKAALRLPPYVDPQGGYSINEEIELIHGTPPDYVDGALALYQDALADYFALLDDPMGVDMARVPGADSGVPFGYHLFQTEVPGRSLFSASYVPPAEGETGTEGEGETGTEGETPPKAEEPAPEPIVDEDEDGNPDILFAGYKDLVLLFNTERDFARAAAKLARLYALRSQEGDADLARQVIGDAQQQSYSDGTILAGVFPEGALEGVDERSGFAAAKAAWEQGLTELSSVKSFLDGNANPLGLDEGFLALVQVPLVREGLHVDSFNYFASLVIPSGGQPSGPLLVAHEAYEDAHKHYAQWRVNQDTIESELGGLRSQFGDRLARIVGAEYSDPPTPAYETPEDNEGGEIYLQLLSIEQAKLRIEHNAQQIANLEEQMNNEIERRGKEEEINDLIAKTFIQYGDKQASLTQEIGSINAMQAHANQMAQAISSIGGGQGANPFGFVAHGLNAGLQSSSEQAKASLQAQKERLQAQQSADIAYLSDDIAAANSEARVKDLLLGMHTLAIESQEAALMLTQEMGRLQNLLTEKAHLETRWTAAEADLGDRYFADPSHRIIMNQAIAEAGFAFDKARLWVFMLARALEYKWNTPLAAEGYIGNTYSPSSVFAIRNAEELVDMARALWNLDGTLSVGVRGGTTFVRYSLKEDFLKFRSNVGDGMYPDPATGETVTALEAFRSYLKNVAPHGAPTGSISSDEVVRIEFSTNKENLAGTFFGASRWNEKIRWITVKINASNAVVPDLQVWLEQSGTAYIRNQTQGVADPADPDFVTGEMTGYPTRYWYFEGSQWKSKPTFGFGINAVITADPQAPPAAYQKEEFFEMSPAVSTWILEIPVQNSGIPVLDLDRVSDIEIWFYNKYYVRN